MKRILATVALSLALAAPLAADTWVIDRSHSETTFQIRHLVSKVSGRFTDFAGTIVGDPAKPEAATVEFTIKAASINTDNADRDADLRSANFFDVAKFPEITFKSSAIRKIANGKFEAAGTLTMHGVAKQIVIPVEYFGAVRDPWGNDKAGFSARITLDRKDYNLTWNKALDNGGVLLGDDVDVVINLEAAKKKDAAK
ncbi:MAG: YceI family protein [Thermoanaerobaculia bacterium]